MAGNGLGREQDNNPRSEDKPPLLPFVLAIGVTGTAEDIDRHRERLAAILSELAAHAARLHSANAQFFSDAPARLYLHMSSANEAAASIAAESGFEPRLFLPGPGGLTQNDLAVLELPADDDALDPLAIAGLAIVSQSDLLIAVGDGPVSVVKFAVEMARPVIQIPADAASDAFLRWNAFEPAFVTGPDDPATSKPYSPEQIGAVFGLLLAPPEDTRERQFIRDFQAERRRLWHLRIEYPLLLSLAGISRFKRRHFRTDHSAAETDEEWTRYREACFRAEAVTVDTDLLRSWYEWTDSLAGHFAQSYRSGHVFNFVLGALAVLMGVSNLVLPRWSIVLETALFFVVLAILVNTVAGNRQQWHRRWLDYRQLAERLRPMRTLKLLGVAAPDPPGSGADPVARRWVEWYAARAWRAIGAPTGRIDLARLEALTATIVDHEIAPQVAYHHKAARQVLRLDRRLGIISFSAFVLALCSSIVLLTGFAIAPAWVDAHYDWFTVLAAGLPAIGTAAVGIRVQGDHSGSAARSERSAVVLAQIGERLRSERSSLKRAADLTEQAARAMLSDLDEWQLLNQQHDLSVG